MITVNAQDGGIVMEEMDKVALLNKMPDKLTHHEEDILIQGFMPKFVRILLDGKKYIAHTKAVKEHELNIIEDNMFYGCKIECTEKEIRKYEKEAKDEYRKLLITIARDNNIVLTLASSTLRFVPVSEETPHAKKYPYRLDINALQVDDWDEGLEKIRNAHSYMVTNMKDAKGNTLFKIIKKKDFSNADHFRDFTFSTKEEAENYLREYQNQKRLAKKKKQQGEIKLQKNANDWLAENPEVFDKLNTLREACGNLPSNKIRKILRPYNVLGNGGTQFRVKDVRDILWRMTHRSS